MSGSAAVVGLGLIGGSLAAALKNAGWHVRGSDLDASVPEEALKRGVIDAVDDGSMVDVCFIATPVSFIADHAATHLTRSKAVSDVGSVKGPVVAVIDHPLFVGGHPMAGSEKHGLDAIRADLFVGATWVLTPTEATDVDAYLAVRAAVESIGAEVVTLEPAIHDEMVATVSHVPHLAASALMKVALDRAADHAAVLRLAAGGFRDMTRIAAGHPELWADIVLNNGPAVTAGLDRVIGTLGLLRDHIEAGDRAKLAILLQEASEARQGLPTKQGRPSELVTLAVAIPDQPGALGQVLTLFGELAINVEDLEINHSIEGTRGTLLVAIEAGLAPNALAALSVGGFSAVERSS